ncbi:hypothetical protein [Nannocystis pusilla]|uniref:hypothetical protein n=1 Tax=Nannocystis pusilla TaxID=889268 RepID=UPI003B7E4E2F
MDRRRPRGHPRGRLHPFSVEVTRLGGAGKPIELVVRAIDDPHDLAKPRGKQDWQEQPHSIWYPRTTGIWQSVWLERVPHVHVAHLRWTSNLYRWEIGFSAQIAGLVPATLSMRLRLFSGRRQIVDDQYQCTHNELHRRIPSPIPASTTRATSCCGARARRTCSTPSSSSSTTTASSSTRCAATPPCARSPSTATRSC